MMNKLRRNLLRVLLPSTLLTLFCSGKATAKFSADVAGDAPKTTSPDSVRLSTGAAGQRSGARDAALTDLSHSDGSLLGYKNSGLCALPQTVKDKLDRVLYVSDYDVLNDNSPEQNALNLQRMLYEQSGRDEIVRIVFADTGTLYLNGPIVIPNNTDIEIKCGVTVSAATGNVKPVFVSQYWSYVLSQRDVSTGFAVNRADVAIRSDYIGLWGGGTVDYNYSTGNAASGLDMSCICIASARRVRLGDGLLVAGAIKYACLIANVEFLDVQRLRFNNRSDGLHLQPPIDYACVRNLYGTTGDDMFALTGGDYLDYDIGLRGAFNQIDIKGIHGENSLCAVKIAGNDSTPINHISVDGIYGTFLHSVFRLWTDSKHLSSTRVRTCTLDNIGALPGNGYPAIELKTIGTGTLSVDYLKTGALSGDYSAAGPVIAVTTGTAANASVRVSHLSCHCPRNTAQFLEIGGAGAGADASFIDNLSVHFDSVRFNPAVAEGFGVKITRGQIARLTVRGCTTLAPGHSVVRQSGGKVAAVVFDTFTQSGGRSFSAVAKNSDSSLPAFQFIGGFYTSPEKLLDLVTGCSIDLSGPSVLLKTGELFSTSAGVVSLQGHLTYRHSCIPRNPVPGVTWSVSGFGIAADVSNLSVARGGYCFNTNDSLADGIGPAVTNGSAWRGVI